LHLQIVLHRVLRSLIDEPGLISDPSCFPLLTFSCPAVRDLLAWAGFINATAPQLGVLAAYAHGAHLVLLDGIGLGVGLSAEVGAPAVLA
jgi:hypothetical protein